MDDIVFDALVRYFNTLAKVGYKSYGEVQKVLFLVAIRDFVYNDFRGLITEDDYRIIEKVLYNVFGTTCLIPFPNFCKLKDMNKLHLGDITELVYMAKQNKPDQGGSVDKDAVTTIAQTEIDKFKNGEFSGFKYQTEQSLSSMGQTLSEYANTSVVKKKNTVSTVEDIPGINK